MVTNIEDELYNYPAIEFQLIATERKIEYITKPPKDVSAVDFGKVGSSGSSQKDAFTECNELNKLISKHNELLYKQKNVEAMVDSLNDKEKNFVDLYYFQKKSLNSVLVEMNYSETSHHSAKQLKNEILKKLEKYWLCS